VNVAARAGSAPVVNAGALMLGLAAAVALRVAVGHGDVAGSPSAGLVFGGCLAALALAAGVVVRRPTTTGLLVGLGGAAVLCLPPALMRLGAEGHRPAGSFAGWAVVVTAVAVAEEALLRGALYDALREWRGELVAVAGAAVAFALMHAPVYGWHVVSLDLAVGVWLGALRAASGSLAAPVTAHAVADLAGWWLR
jgi:membrane protease YdiL (CAAX protease family)